MCAEVAIKVLDERRLKLSEIKHLNDPYELMPFDLSDPIIFNAVSKTRDELHEKHGILSFSETWIEPVMWSHYTYSHEGICLGFDVLEETAQKVKYIKTPLRFPINDPTLTRETTRDMLSTKYKAWEYESEWRIWSDDLRHRDEKTGYCYTDIDNYQIGLREIILGARCTLDISKIIDLSSNYPEPINIAKARQSLREFKMELDPNFTDSV